MKRLHPFPQRAKDLLPTYFACLDHESAAAGSHQNTLLSLEVGLLGIQYLSRDDMSNFWILALVGILLCFLIGPLYEYRANNVDYWRNAVLSLVKGTALEKTFHDGGYGSSVFGAVGQTFRSLIRHWFTAVLIPFVILAWFVALAAYPPTVLDFNLTVAHQWAAWFVCETVWVGILVYLRSRQGKK